MKIFEIKSHDGPGRYGKLGDWESPLIINKDDFTIAKDESSAYDVEKEIAERSVNQTIEKAKTVKDKEIAVIQGSKYIDLRIKCLKELEELGYNGFIIANADDLLLHPRDLVDLVVRLRENMKSSSYLIFPFAEAQFIPLLVYMGIDAFFDDIGEYYSYINVLMSPTKTYDLETYKLYDMDQKELEKYNKNTVDFVLREVREHMKNSSLRNLVEERSATSPQYASALRILDKNYSKYLLEHTQLY
ncbi:archaeosine tRNA-ribosyltransferase [Methanobrevibacter olleyae]|uniref:Archaeosine tRNA-ribosyltransferase TgtA n=1 Tax=Methanobrevibacter olleyae TaxID=294671 RepID=A0A126QYU8_METOL|nr:archaeosine tRNA-ribosyltransferase [Methanobrevibacter olleyae]AMK14962.1 archaeosine tRNA-ribosyltransferase TgtA [Methanobrevibacter olleyae]